MQLGGSLELNDADHLRRRAERRSAALRRGQSRAGERFAFPKGTTFAVAERLGVTWDRRDNPLGATRGTLFSAGVEHVRADPGRRTTTRRAATDAADDLFAADDAATSCAARIASPVTCGSATRGMALALSAFAGASTSS